MAHQLGQQRELAVSEAQLLLAQLRALCQQIQVQVAALQLGAVVALRGVGAPQQGAHTRQQLAQAKGLHHIIIRAALQPHDAVQLCAARSEHDDGHFGAAPQHAADGDAVQAGEHQVQQQQVRQLLARQVQAFNTIAGFQHLKSLRAQVEHQHFAHSGLIFDY